MSFKMKYRIRRQLLPSGTKRRSGRAANAISFIVAHDTGNPTSTAAQNVNYFTRSANDMSASAHIFVDDQEIIECVPAFSNPEKAWHVLYNRTEDNKLFGVNANDAAIGVEYCYGGKIDAGKAYRRYVWVIAYLCYVHKITPDKVIGHHILDPARKTDPVSGLAASGRTYSRLLSDIADEYRSCIGNQKKK
jgi:N-acetylmuramoyl-L-alanine amidase